MCKHQRHVWFIFFAKRDIAKTILMYDGYDRYSFSGKFGCIKFKPSYEVKNGQRGKPYEAEGRVDGSQPPFLRRRVQPVSW